MKIISPTSKEKCFDCVDFRFSTLTNEVNKRLSISGCVSFLNMVVKNNKNICSQND